MESLKERIEQICEEIDEILEAGNDQSLYIEYNSIKRNKKLDQEKKYESLFNFKTKISTKPDPNGDLFDDEQEFKSLLKYSYAIQKKYEVLNDEEKKKKRPKYLSHLKELKKELDKRFENAEEQRIANLLIIGPSGSGKSSFVNLISVIEQSQPLCEINKVKIETKFLDGELKGDGQVFTQKDSQTNKATLFSFRLHLESIGYYVNLIDTPGLGDTRGSQQDEKNIDNIFESLKKNNDSGKEILHGIVLLINGTLPRLTEEQLYILYKANNIIPTLLRTNIVVIMSNVAFDQRANADISEISKIINSNVPQERIFNFQNDLFSFDYKQKDRESAPIIEKNFLDNRKTLSKLFKICSALEAKPAKLFASLGDARAEFRVNLIELLDKISVHLKKREEAQKILTDIQTKNTDFVTLSNQLNEKSQSMVEEKQSNPSSSHNTVCCYCWHTCHQGCGLEETTQKGSTVFLGCWAFSGNNCAQCPERCGIGNHVHQRNILVKVKKQQEIFVENLEVKAKLNSAKSEKEKIELIEASLEREIDNLEKSIKGCKDKIRESLKKMKQVCSYFNYSDELSFTVKMYEKKLFNKQSELQKNPNNKALKNEISDFERIIREYNQIKAEFLNL